MQNNKYQFIITSNRFIAILTGGIVLWKRNRKRTGLSTSEYFFNADTTDLTDEELQELNDDKEMII